jgi:hypothetical protein
MVRVALIHTVPSVINAFTPLIAEILPGLDIYHVLDESLLQVLAKQILKQFYLIILYYYHCDFKGVCN